MAGQTWNSIQTAIIVALSQAPSPYNTIPPDFAVLFPQGTSYAELRIYRDLVMLCTRQQNSSLTTTPGSRVLDLSAMANPNGGPIIVPDGLSLIVPAGTATPALGSRILYKEASLDLIDLIWPQEAVTSGPVSAEWIGRYWAMLDDHTMVVAPTPDSPNGEVYTAEITGLFQPTPISNANQTTYLSTNYPDLLEAAIMVFMTGALQRNFGAQSDDPRQAQSWEVQYQTLMATARNEERRRRGLAPDVAAASQPAKG